MKSKKNRDKRNTERHRQQIKLEIITEKKEKERNQGHGSHMLVANL
jgi:hypothetical protein